jgi:hypothetical protein
MVRDAGLAFRFTGRPEFAATLRICCWDTLGAIPPIRGTTPTTKTP